MSDEPRWVTLLLIALAAVAIATVVALFVLRGPGTRPVYDTGGRVGSVVGTR